MTRIFFYHDAPNRVLAMIALIGKTYQQGKPLLVYAPDEEMAATLDRQLWINPPTGFIPHVSAVSPLADQTPVVITADLASPNQTERLFNLSFEVPPNFSRFTSVIEIVSQEEEDRQAGRARVKFYKDRGYEVNFFNLSERH